MLYINANLVALHFALKYKALMNTSIAPKILIISALMTLYSAPAFAQTRVGLHTSSGSCMGCDLSGKDMPGMVLRDANFAGSTFNRSNLSGGRVYKSDLSSAHFKKAFLVRVTGEYVNFDNSDMQDVTMVETKLHQSVFSNTNLSRADLGRSEFTHSNFDGANLTSASAPQANFAGSHFVGANFEHANLQGAQFTESILKDVKFGNAMMENAILNGADFSGADLSEAIGLSQAQLDIACGDPETQLPLGLSVPYCGDIATELDSHRHIHPASKQSSEKAARRLDRAVENLEFLMKESSRGDVVFRRELQKIHSDLVSARREIEK